MSVLSSYVASGNIQAVTLALTAAAGANSQNFPHGNLFKVPLNAKYSDPYGICTLNPSLCTFTLPSGLYSVGLTLPSLKVVNSPVLMSTKITINGVTTSKWPFIKVNQEGGEPNSSDLAFRSFSPAMVYLANSSSIALEQYWVQGAGTPVATSWFGSTFNDGESNVYYRLDIWKVR